MITRSDNGAANAIDSVVGAAGLLRWPTERG